MDLVKEIFMKMRNRTGPSTDPWGTPDSTGTGSEAWPSKVIKVAKIRNRNNQVPHLTQDTNGKVTNSQ